MFLHEPSNVPQVRLQWSRIQAVLTIQLTSEFSDPHVQIASSSNELVIDGKALLRHPGLPDGLHQSTKVVEQCQVGQLAQKVGHLVVALGEVQVSPKVSFNGNCNVAACYNQQHNHLR